MEKMTVQQAINVMEKYTDITLSKVVIEAHNMAIEALEKQIAKRPITYPGTNRADCPQCGNTVRGIKEPFGDYCSKCGKKLEWSE